MERMSEAGDQRSEVGHSRGIHTARYGPSAGKLDLEGHRLLVKRATAGYSGPISRRTFRCLSPEMPLTPAMTRTLRLSQAILITLVGALATTTSGKSVEFDLT